MATLNITVNESNLNSNILEIKEELNSSCISFITISAIHSIGDQLNITITNVVGTYTLGATDLNYTGLGNNYISSVNNQYLITFPNGNGVFPSITLNFNNLTKGTSDSITVSRFNDSQLCI